MTWENYVMGGLTEEQKTTTLNSVLAETKAAMKKAGLTTNRVIKRIKEGLDAYEVKTAFDKDRCKFFYSKKLVSHGTRLKAAEMAIPLLEMKPAEKKEITGKLTMNHELSPELNEMFEKIYQKGRK